MSELRRAAQAMAVKPHIKLWRSGIWACESRKFIGLGATPALAYADLKRLYIYQWPPR